MPKLTYPQHQIGTHQGAPTFSAQTLPAGTAPKSSTYTPHPDAETINTPQDALDTITGATSADVNTGLGKPIQGQSSAEQHHDGQAHRKRQRHGLAGLTETENNDAKENLEGVGVKEDRVVEGGTGRKGVKEAWERGV